MPSNEKTDAWRFAQTFASVSSSVAPFLDAVVAELEARSWNPGDVFAIRLALDEAVANAIEHGNRRDPDKKVRLSAEISGERILVSIQDEGPGFNFDAIKDPTLDENLELPQGRGLFLIRNFMTHVWHNDKGNIIYMEKIPQDEAQNP
ncbi:MAG: ATP-binding protein [Thermoguttaceae bacterium]|nr:ATP-binding protein [Thermoguttaceae bacterium]